MKKTISKKVTSFKGRLNIPGDKSISHRALILGAVAQGNTKVNGLLESHDVLNTMEALKKLGVDIHKENDGTWVISGVTDFKQPDSVIDMGNSGTAVRLLMGLLSAYPLRIQFTGDDSLRSRPMKRITDPLSKTGAVFQTTNGKLPIIMQGIDNEIAIDYVLPVASAQLKSALLLSGLRKKAKSTVFEPIPCRDHTERMLKAFGADIHVQKNSEDINVITLSGKKRLTACNICVPTDISSAAFAIVAALITKDSEITIPNVGINPLRTGILDTLLQMGADIHFENRRVVSFEPVADLRIKTSPLKGIEVCAEKAPSMIDEYPVLAIAAAFAEGETILHGLSELKVKESNRFKAIIEGLNKNGIDCMEIDDNTIKICGRGKKACGGGMIESKLDHRIAMSFMVMGMASDVPVCIDDVSSVATSFPEFISMMNKAGANIYDYCD